MTDAAASYGARGITLHASGVLFAAAVGASAILHAISGAGLPWAMPVIYTALLVLAWWRVRPVRLSPRHCDARCMGYGVLLGLCLFAIGGFGYTAAEALGLQSSLTTASSLGPALVIGVVVAAAAEEVVFRGAMLEAVSGRAGVVVQAVAFSVYHLDLYQLLPTLLYGLVLGTVVVRAGNLRIATVGHLVLNLMGMVVYAVRAS